MTYGATGVGESVPDGWGSRRPTSQEVGVTSGLELTTPTYTSQRVHGPEPISAPRTVLVADLRPGFSPRTGVDPEHVERLAELDGDWPPIMVHADTMAVIDGNHRLAAARSLGMRTVGVVIFEGTQEEASIEAIRANVEHGLPLSLADRKRAAAELLAFRSGWSDRSLGQICGLAGKTIGKIRAENETKTRGQVHVGRAGCRVGLDGRIRPTSPSALEHTVTAALAEDPVASLRTIARRTGASPETVRRVRRLLTEPREVAATASAASRTWRQDAALASTDERAEFAAWFDRNTVQLDECTVHLSHVPISRVYEVIDEVRRRIAVWETFARDLGRRTTAERSL